MMDGKTGVRLGARDATKEGHARWKNWLPLRVPKASADIRLFCFPHAGGGAAFYRDWPDALGERCDVCALEYPGRWTRRKEHLITCVPAMVNAVADGLEELLVGRYALFGFSYGAVIAFELCRELRRRGVLGPEHLFVAARGAPHKIGKGTVIHRLSDAQFMREVGLRYGMLPKVILDDPEMTAIVLPILRADFTAVETYEYREEAPLSCAVSAYGGQGDLAVEHDALRDWARHTQGQFSKHLFPGDHFFLQSCGGEVVHRLREQLRLEWSPR